MSGIAAGLRARKKGLGYNNQRTGCAEDALYIEPFLYIRAETWMELYTFNPGPPCVRGYEALKNTRRLDASLTFASVRAPRGEERDTQSFLSTNFARFKPHAEAEERREERREIDGGSNQSRKCNFRGKHSHQATTRIAGIGSIDICLKGLALCESRRS